MITNAQLTTTAANVLYSPASTTTGVTAMYLCNVTGTTATANVFVVPFGAPVANCRIYSNLSIAGSDTHISDMERIVLNAGDSIWANCSVNNAIVMTISSTGV